MFRTALAIALLTFMLESAYARSSGPPDGYAGNPPNFNNCTACHSSFPLNSGNGSLTLDFPATYTPGETYTISVTLTDDGQSRWGFELTSLDGSNQQAGMFTVTDAAHTQLSDNSGSNPDYMKQTSVGTYAGDTNGALWSFDWTAPASDIGQVMFYLAGNAANNNGNSLGDYIYATSGSSAPASGVGGDRIAGTVREYRLVSTYPNPFNSTAHVVFTVPRKGVVRAEVFDMLGRHVAELLNGELAPGTHSLAWQAEGPSGVYFLRLTSDNGWQATRKLIYMR